MFSSTYLLNKRNTTQMMMNIRAIPAKIPIIAGSMYLSGSRDSCFAVSEKKKKFQEIVQ